MKPLLVLLPVFSLLAACSSTPAELQATTQPTIQSYSENYQEIYRRVATAAKQCLTANIGDGSAMIVDTQIYSELGYGEVIVWLNSWGIRNFYFTAKIERAGSGSRMTMHSGNTLAADRQIQIARAWASGDSSCPII